MPHPSRSPVSGGNIAAIATGIAGIMTAGAAVGGDTVVIVGLLVFFGLGLAWFLVDALTVRRDRGAVTDAEVTEEGAGSDGDAAISRSA